jgi:hypothetical protein
MIEDTINTDLADEKDRLTDQERGYLGKLIEKLKKGQELSVSEDRFVVMLWRRVKDYPTL